MSEDGGEDSGEKTFDPTPGKLEEARKQGDVPRSVDANAAAAYLALLAVFTMAGAWALERSAEAMLIFIDQPDRLMGLVLGPGGPGLTAAMMLEISWALAPLFLAPAVAVLISLFAQQAFAFSGEKIEPKLSKISVISNAKQKFGPTGLVEFAKSAVKLIAIGVALFYVLMGDLDKLVGSATADPRVLGALMLDELNLLLMITCVIAIVIGAIDLVWQRFDHRRRLRMSFEDIRQEMKQSEGDPHVKSQRRARAQAIAMNQMLLDVPKADVVIVNPEHYAVALKWSRTRGSAPECVAKGVDAVALRIREVAETAGVPIHSDPPTARALHATVEIGREIRPDQYKAVAAAIRFADRVRKAARQRGGR